MWINVAVCGFLTILHFRQVVGQLTVTPGEQDFSPSVSATCQAGTMTITVDTTSPFSGVIHARDYRKRECLASGDGGKSNIFRVNLYAKQNDSDFCGVVTKEQERSLPIAVRFHKTLELADDKFYVITCGRSGFRNSRNQSSDIYVKLMSENDRKLTELVYGREYKLRVGMTNPDGMFGFRVTSCFGFSGQNGTAAAQLVDKRGCPSKHVISKFEYDEKKGWADAKIFSMFRFAQTSEIHIQCEVVICKGSCGEPVCDDDFDTIRDPILDTESTTALGTASAFVVEPSTELISDCSFCGYQSPWLLYLCIAFGVLFLIMLIINIFLCSAMTCSCSRSEVIEKDPSIIDEYDPYRSWHGSHYGSRYSLNGAGGPVKNNGYLSGASTVHSTRSYSTNSDHYAIVHSRPGSGYSPNANGVRQTVPPGRHRGPGSTGSNYSGKDQRY